MQILNYVNIKILLLLVNQLNKNVKCDKIKRLYNNNDEIVNLNYINVKLLNMFVPKIA